MSEHTVDILVRARETAIQTLREVNEEIQRSGRMSEETRKAYMDARREIVDQNRALNTLRLAYREQTQTLSMTANAFQSVATTVGKAQRMYEQYNVAQIKTNQLAQQVRDAQEKYNAAVFQFGPNSQQAIKAQQELKEASEKLAAAQRENVMQLIGFGLQIPSFLKNILDIKTNFQLLAFQLSQTDIVGWASRSATAITTFSTTAVTAIKAVAFELGLLTGGLTLLGSEIYRDVAKQKELVTTTGLTEDEFDMLSGLAQGLGISVGRLTEAIEDGRIKVAQYGEEWARLEEKIKKAKQALQSPVTVPPIGPPTAGPPITGPPTGPPATGCPLCGRIGGHAAWCPILTNEWYGFQQGGIVTRPTLALLGERGPEAVLPLREGPSGPMKTDVQMNITISSLHVSDEQEVQRLFDRLQRKIVTALR